MNAALTKDERELMTAVKYMPAISIILPFNPKISLKTELEHRIKTAINKVEKELHDIYPKDKALPVIERLHKITAHLNFDSDKMSIAIFVSMLLEKVFYLDIAVEEKIIIDESFEIRDLVYSQKQMRKFMVLLLSAAECKLFLGDGKHFMHLTNMPESASVFENDIAQKVANFSDSTSRKEILLNKFLIHIDDALTQMLKKYPLPVFVLGAQKVLGHFKKSTHNEAFILNYIHGNYENASEVLLKKVLKPYLEEWKEKRNEELVKELEMARDANKVSFGIRDVWATAGEKNDRLLLVEKDFVFPAHQADGKTLFQQKLEMENPFYIKDAVDDIIEKVLAGNGEVEFVDNDILNPYGHIALIHYY